GDYSTWATTSFYTGHCLVSTGTSTSYRITGFSTSDGYTNISNLDNVTSNSYNNYSSLIVSQSPWSTFDYAVSVPGYTNVDIWIDYNKDLTFDESELLAQRDYVFSASTFRGTIEVPEGITTDDDRMRVRSRYYWQTIATPCGDMTYGETEDYTVSVVPVPDC